MAVTSSIKQDLFKIILIVHQIKESKVTSKNTNQPKLKNSTRDDLISRKWGICSADEKTLSKMFELYCSFGLTGPLFQFPFSHAVFRYNPQQRYTVPYRVVEYLVKNRISESYDFYAFSKALNQHFTLYREGNGMHTNAMQKVFDGASVARNRRTWLLSENVNAYQTRRATY